MAALLYLDTSAAIPLFIREQATDRIRAFLESQPEGAIVISPWVTAEFASTLGLKLRMGAVEGTTHAAAWTQWRRFIEGVRSLEIAARHFEEAASLCRKQDLALRAGDALHLAVAAAYGCALVTMDERMAKAAPELGVQVGEIPSR